MQKFYWSNQQPAYTRNLHNVSCPDQFDDNRQSKLYHDFSTSLTLNINKPAAQQQLTSLGSKGTTQTKIGHQDQVCSVQVRNECDHVPGPEDNSIVNTNKVVLKLGDVAVDSPQIMMSEAARSIPGARQYNRTWNENTKSQYNNELLRGRQRKSIQNQNIFHHDYENVYDDNDSAARDKKCPSSSARNTPRSRKKKKQQQVTGGGVGGVAVYRSKSCERVGAGSSAAADRDAASDSLSPPSTPTPSLLQSVAARAIQCVDIKGVPCVSAGHGTGRVSPADSLAYEGAASAGAGVAGVSADMCRDLLRPAANLADRMRGRMEYVNKKMRIIRSRSAERLRGYIRPEAAAASGPEVRRQSGGHTWASEAACPRTGDEATCPVLGQARALVTCRPSPYDRDALAFQAGDIIDILHMNPNGQWRGRCNQRVGQFKFVHVELLVPARNTRSRPRPGHAHKHGRGGAELQQPAPAWNIYDVMRILDMQHHLPVFVLNGYEDLTLFKDLDEDELDYLGVHDSKHRENLIEMAAILFPEEHKNSSDNESLHVVDCRQ